MEKDVATKEELRIERLASYLNDHLAGSVVALELLEHLEKESAGVDRETFANLHREISADQDVLKKLLQRFDQAESALKKAGAWFSEKLARVKLKLGHADEGPLGRLEALEVLSLGVEGKRGLWVALGALVDQISRLQNVDYPGLIERAVEQRAIVERLRLEMAMKAFTGRSPG